MDDFTDGVAYFDISDQHVTVAARLHNSWIHVSTESSSFKQSSKLKKTYTDLCDAANAQIENEHALEEAENASQKGQTTVSDASSENQPHDSGYASSEHDDPHAANCSSSEQDAKSQLQEWLLCPAVKHFHELHAHHCKPPKNPSSVFEWYLANVYAFRIQANQQDEFIIEEHQNFDGDSFIKEKLIPQTTLPQYLRKLADVNWYSPHDVNVCATSHDIHHPIHPTLVEIDISTSDTSRKTRSRKTHFFKLATESTMRAVRRELRILHYLQRHDLINDSEGGVRAPHLHGLVSSPCSTGSRSKICGFLLNTIPQPSKPLTEMMSSSIAQSRRDSWAKECERMVKVLHKNNIVWGDAKADNFLVDKHDRLWIIDFGGSYTPGWMDPELNETKEGDEMAKSLIVDTVKDPTEVENGGGPSKSSSSKHDEEETQEIQTRTGGKRKAGKGNSSSRKKAKH